MATTSADIHTLEVLYNELVNSMNNIDQVITQVDSKYGQAKATWVSNGEQQFDAAWQTGKKNLSELCRAFAAAASGLADQHNGYAYAARERGANELNTNVVSPR